MNDELGYREEKDKESSYLLVAIGVRESPVSIFLAVEETADIPDRMCTLGARKSLVDY